ncbi:MAG: hypothetical protein K2M40_06610 [Muribaculaceae bacterium]|nr:hypothetical protein [Muribaculaceae bacterium]
METKININLKDESFDLEIHGASLNHISNLSTIGEAVADNLKASLMLLGVEPEKANEGVNLLLQGNYDIHEMLRAIF